MKTPLPVPPDSEFKLSSYTGSRGGCVSVAKVADGSVFVRDSRDPTKTTLCFTRGEWDAFVAGVKDGEFDVD